MRSRLAWAFGGFVLVALVAYRFLTRVPGPAPVAAPAAETTSPAAVAVAAAEATSPAAVAVDEALEAADAAAGDDVAPGDPHERIRALRRKLEETREAPLPASAPAEPPLDDRRHSVREAGRSAADAMRRAAERPDRPEQPGTADPAGPVEPVC